VNVQLRTSMLDHSLRRNNKELGLHWRTPLSKSKLTDVNIKKGQRSPTNTEPARMKQLGLS
jgi:hypothetical protein